MSSPVVRRSGFCFAVVSPNTREVRRVLPARFAARFLSFALRARFARGLHGVFIVAEAGKHHDRQIGVLGPYLRDQRQAVNLGHADVQNQAIAGIQIEPRFDFRAIGQGGSSMAFPPKIGSQKSIQEPVIVNNEEVHGIMDERNI